VRYSTGSKVRPGRAAARAAFWRGEMARRGGAIPPTLLHRSATSAYAFAARSRAPHASASFALWLAGIGPLVEEACDVPLAKVRLPLSDFSHFATTPQRMQEYDRALKP